jgi:hypothetical protein
MAHWLGVDDHFVNFCPLLPGVKDFCALHTDDAAVPHFTGIKPSEASRTQIEQLTVQAAADPTA